MCRGYLLNWLKQEYDIKDPLCLDTVVPGQWITKQKGDIVLFVRKLALVVIFEFDENDTAFFKPAHEDDRFRLENIVKAVEHYASGKRLKSFVMRIGMFGLRKMCSANTKDVVKKFEPTLLWASKWQIIKECFEHYLGQYIKLGNCGPWITPGSPSVIKLFFRRDECYAYGPKVHKYLFAYECDDWIEVSSKP